MPPLAARMPAALAKRFSRLRPRPPRRAMFPVHPLDALTVLGVSNIRDAKIELTNVLVVPSYIDINKLASFSKN